LLLLSPIARQLAILVIALSPVGNFQAAMSHKDAPRPEHIVAKKVSDLFMTGLIANSGYGTKQGYSSDDLRAKERDVGKSVSHVLASCGRPLNMRPENGGVPVSGESILVDGTKHVTYTFIYLCRTTLQPKGTRGHYRFTVTVEAGQDGKYYVAGLGCCCKRPDESARPKRNGRIATNRRREIPVNVPSVPEFPVSEFPHRLSSGSS
jgi:hypothetical protein